MVKFPSTILCPNCRSEINLQPDFKGLLTTNDILTMRVRTPFYVHAQKVAEVSLHVSVCPQCNTILGINRKSM